MAGDKDSNVTSTPRSAQRFIDLKAKVKAECQRRAHTGSVSSYAGASYDYTNVPDSGVIMGKEHYEKNAVPLNAITGDVPTSGTRVIKESEIVTMETKVTALKGKSMTASQGNTGCKASCTGLCSTGCASGCTSCTSCSGCSGCSGCGGCDGGCYTGCSGCSGCGSGCAGSCYGCTGGCTDNCTGCLGTCSGSCWSSAAGGGSCGALCTAMCQSSSTN